MHLRSRAQIHAPGRLGTRDEVADEPSHPLNEYLANQAVHEATERADSAYRSRDRLARYMYYIEEAHHDADAGDCTCGKPIEDCDAYKAAVLSMRLINDWHTRNKDRMFEHRPHDLPRDHPDAKGQSWTDWQGKPTLDDDFKAAIRKVSPRP